MDIQDSLAELGASLARQLAWIAAADNKIAPVFAIDTAMLGLLAGLLPGASNITTAIAVVCAIAALMLVASVVFLAHAAFPRLDGPKESMVFFGGIAKQSESGFIERAMRGPTPEYLSDLARQIYRNSEIATIKFSSVRTSMILMFATVPFWVVSVFLMYLARP